jgi:enoyl-CoA hydratase/carnithine racemase
MVIADESAKFGEGHAKFAQLPGGGGSVRLPRRIGAARAKYMMFTGELCTAARAAEWGLVDEVAPSGGLVDAVNAYAAKVADKSPLGLARMKHLVYESLDQPLEVALRSEILMSELHVHSKDRNEGLGAFAEKRTPSYCGA